MLDYSNSSGADRVKRIGDIMSGNLIFSSAAGVTLYNTVDQTTNYERSQIRYNTNILEIGHFYGGTASTRAARFGTTTVAGATSLTRFIQLQGITPFISYNWSGSGLAGQMMNIGSGNTFVAAAGNQTVLGIDPTVTQTGTASYTMLLINPTESTTGSGTKLLADLQVGGVSKVTIDNTGFLNVKPTGKAAEFGDGTTTTTNITMAGSRAEFGFSSALGAYIKGGSSRPISLAANGSSTAQLTVAADGSGVVVAGATSTSYVAKTALYTLVPSDSIVNVTSGTHTQTLHTAVGFAGMQKTIKNSGAGIVTVACNGAQTIDGIATYLLATQYKYVVLVSDGANWIVVGNN